jgi:hypothetical protein
VGDAFIPHDGPAALKGDAADAATVSEAPGDAAEGGDAAVACNSVTLSGAIVAENTVTGPAPAAQGGAITAGTYNLTSFTFYGPEGEGGSFIFRATAVIDDVVYVDSGDQTGQFTVNTIETDENSEAAFASTYLVSFDSPNNLGGLPSCGTSEIWGGNRSYTATSTTFTLYLDPSEGNSAGTLAFVFTLQ